MSLAQKEKIKRHFDNLLLRCIKCCQLSTWRLLLLIGEEKLILFITAISVAIISFSVDLIVGTTYKARLYALDAAAFSVPLQYCIWLASQTLFIIFSAGVVHLVNPQTAGTGLPEMKAILSGIDLKNFLSWKSAATKYVAGCAALCSGLPIAKAGMLMCISSCICNKLCRKIITSRGIYQNESRKVEMLSAAIAVAFACTFNCPVSSVLFVIEVTASFFDMNNYWRAFFCTICGSIAYQMLSALAQYNLPVGASMATNLSMHVFQIASIEFIVFSLIGVVCGLAGALFVYAHRSLILQVRARTKLSAFLQKHVLLYPFLVSLLVASLTFPPILGEYSPGRLNARIIITQLLGDKPLTQTLPETATAAETLASNTWKLSSSGGVFAALAIYMAIEYVCCLFTYTLAVPFGVFMPLMSVGAAIGRIIGEAMALQYPEGIVTASGVAAVVPGGYAIVGAAAMTGSVIQSMAFALLLHEMTLQTNYLLPSLWATVISVHVSRAFMPSLLDSIVQMKKIPFLPLMKPPATRACRLVAKDIMCKDIKYVSSSSTYYKLRSLLISNPLHLSFAVVDCEENMVLLGSVQQSELLEKLERCVRLNDSTFLSKAYMLRGGRKTAVNLAMDKQKNKVGAAVTIDEIEDGSTTISLPPQATPVRKGGAAWEGSRKKGLVELAMKEQLKLLCEMERLRDKINVDDLCIDPAPFQLSEKTTFHKIYSTFVLLRLSQAYVIERGRLVGVITTKEIEAQLGHPDLHQAPRPGMYLRRKTASATIGGEDAGMLISLDSEH